MNLATTSRIEKKYTLGTLRRRIVGGGWRIADLVWLDDRLEIVFRTRMHARRFALTGRELDVVTLAARGRADKWIAYELGISRTTAATHLCNALAKLGLERRTHLALLRLFFDEESADERSSVQLSGRGRTLAALVPLPSIAPYFEELTPAEASVARLAVEGRSNREIATRRSTSTRTVANQLREVYRKYGVNSRVELAASVAALSLPHGR